MERTDRSAEPAREGKRPARKPYRRPVLIEYGPVAKLTLGVNTVGTDGPGNTMKNMSCL